MVWKQVYTLANCVVDAYLYWTEFWVLICLPGIRGQTMKSAEPRTLGSIKPAVSTKKEELNSADASYEEESVADVIKALQNKSDAVLDKFKCGQSDEGERDEDNDQKQLMYDSMYNFTYILCDIDDSRSIAVLYQGLLTPWLYRISVALLEIWCWFLRLYGKILLALAACYMYAPIS